MEIDVSFPGGKKVRAACGGFTVETDQPVERGGDGTAPSPFDLFLCSLAACTGFEVLCFLRERGLHAEDARVVVRAHHGAQPPLVERVAIEIHVPTGFPPRYADAIARAAGRCKVRTQLSQPPEFTVSVVPRDGRARPSSQVSTKRAGSDR